MIEIDAVPKASWLLVRQQFPLTSVLKDKMYQQTSTVTARKRVLAGRLALMIVLMLRFEGIAEEPAPNPSVGISQRVPWTTSRISGSPEPPSPYKADRVFPNLKFKDPTVLTTAQGSDRWYLAELAGKIFSFPNEPDCTQDDAELFLDLKSFKEDFQHIYGVTFHPEFERKRFVYICYIFGKEGFHGDAHVSRFEVTDTNPPRCDPASEQVILTWWTGGHNGGCLKFGPDGYLYITTGDGGPPYPIDENNTGQDISDFKSAVLRIDVDRPENGKNYGIPRDNPFVDHEDAEPAVWAYGFKNPWKITFDAVTGDLWLGDVGLDLWEPVFFVEKGGNYGWSIVEGGQSMRSDMQPGPTPIQSAVIVHPRDEARSLTGGFVYRGTKLKELHGAYIYGDYVTGKIWGLRYDGNQVTWKQELADTSLKIIAFAEDHDLNLYVVDYGGTIHRLVPNTADDINRDFPQTLSATGLFASVASREMAPGVIPYSINAEPWADGAQAERWLAIPGSEQVGVFENNDPLLEDGGDGRKLAGGRPALEERKGTWKYPAGTVFVKTLFLDISSSDPAASSVRQPVETQILHLDRDVWRGYSYIWNQDGTDAVLASTQGEQRTFNVQDPESPAGTSQQTWHFSGRSECMICHSRRARYVLGFDGQQLNRKHTYGNIVDDQLRTLTHIELFSSAVEAPPPLQSPWDHSVSLQQRARSYLDVNCAHCHGLGGAGTAQFRLQVELGLEETGLLDSKLTQGDFGIRHAQLVAPGDPYRSVLYYRMAKLGRGRMPHIGSYVVDEEGLRLMHDWIQELSPQSPAESPEDIDSAERRADHIAALRDLVAGRGDQAALIDRLLQTLSGGLVLASGMHENQFTSDLRERIITQAAEISNPQISDLFEDFVPEEKRRKRVELEPSQVLAIEGNELRGEQLFFDDLRLQCKNCHQIGERGKPFGPNLTNIGRQRDASTLLTSLLSPSEKIEPEYVPFLAVTTEGTLHSGLLVERTADSVVLRDSQSKQTRLSTKEVVELVPQKTSLMPVGQLHDMALQDVADLLAYLQSRQ